MHEDDVAMKFLKRTQNSLGHDAHAWLWTRFQITPILARATSNS
jgi:hypothetical protein